jgi:hypothetical protein
MLVCCTQSSTGKGIGQQACWSHPFTLQQGVKHIPSPVSLGSRSTGSVDAHLCRQGSPSAQARGHWNQAFMWVINLSVCAGT